MNTMAPPLALTPHLATANMPGFALNLHAQSDNTVSELEQTLQPNQIACITCMDFRELPRHGYTLSCAGAIPHDEIRSGLALVLPQTELLLLRAHTDCAKSKAETARRSDESDRSYAARVEARTIERLWEGAITLLSDHAVQAAIERGMVFCMALLDVESRQVEYFEKQSRQLVSSFRIGESTSKHLSEQKA